MGKRGLRKENRECRGLKAGAFKEASVPGAERSGRGGVGEVVGTKIKRGWEDQLIEGLIELKLIEFLKLYLFVETRVSRIQGNKLGDYQSSSAGVEFNL